MTIFDNADLDAHLLQFFKINTVKLFYVLDRSNQLFIQSQRWFSCLQGYSDYNLFSIYDHNVHIRYQKTFIKTFIKIISNTKNYKKNVDIQEIGYLIQNCKFDAFIYLLQTIQIKRKILKTKTIRKNAIYSGDIEIVKYFF